MLEATPSHVVETLEFQFLFEDGREATEQHLAWGDFAAGPALQIVDEVFSERSTGEVTLRLDRLEIDLGRLRAEDFQQAAPDRLRRSLREALREALGAAGAASDDVPSDARSGRQNDFDLVWYVLTHGRPPWRAAYMSGAKYEAAVERVLAQDGETLAQALLASPRQAMLFTRIARQWPRPRRDALARFLDSATPAAAQALQFDRSTPMDRLPAYPDAPAETAGHALRAAFETGLAEARLIGPAFDALIVADQTYLRARLRQAALGPGWRAHFAAGLSSDRRQVLAALFMAPQEAAAALSFAANAVSWQGACQASAEAVSAALNEGLISALLAPGPTRIALTDTLGGMVRAVADLENAHPALLARRLLQAHPKPTGLQPDLDRRLQRLMPPPETSAQSAGQAGEPHTRGDDPASRSALATQEPSLTAIDGLWRLSPEALLDRITILAQGAGWRRALAQDLAVGRRWSRLLPLCAEADDAALVLDLLARPGGWSQGDGQRGLDLQLVQGQALLSHIFVEQHGRLNLADGLASLVAVRAEFDRVTVAEAARTLLATWTPHAVAEPSDRTGLDAQPMPGPTLAEPAGRGATARSDDQPDETSRKTPPQPSDGTGLDTRPRPGHALAERVGYGAMARSGSEADETSGREALPRPLDQTRRDAPSQARGVLERLARD
ncbi:MAG: contractile injection system tape measure protein, partial [Caulobacteraceae bacterium]